MVAQKTFVPGYIITNTGDTLHGEIDDKDWVKNPLSISFKNLSKTETYNTVTQLRGFGIKNKNVYVRKRFKLDVTPFQSEKLLQSPSLIISPDTTLMIKQLVNGRINLYYMADAMAKDHFFIEKQDEPLEELIDHHYLRRNNTGLFEIHNDAFNIQLSNICQDCSYYENKTFKNNYSELSLTPTILKYNNFFGDTKAVIVSKKEINKASIFILASLGTYSFKTQVGIESFSGSGFVASSVGGGVLYRIPSLRKKVGIRIDALYSLYSEGVRISDVQVTPKNLAFLSLNITPQYTLYRNKPSKLDLYLMAGLTYDVKLNNNNDKDYPYSYLYHSMFGAKMGTGVQWKKLDLEFAFLFNDAGLSNFYSTSGTISRFAFTLGYLISR